GNMVWTGSMWVPVSTQNRLPVDAAVSGTVALSGTEIAFESGQNAHRVQLVNLKADIFKIVDAVEVRDDVDLFSGYMTTALYRRFDIIFRNSHDQDLYVYFLW